MPQTSAGRIADVLRVHPDMVRVIASTFELSHLPNRVELRLKSTGRVIGYTLAHIRDEAGEVAGAALFFKGAFLIMSSVQSTSLLKPAGTNPLLLISSCICQTPLSKPYPSN